MAKKNPYTKQLEIMNFLKENFHISKMIETCDNWYPNWNEDYVFVALRIYYFKGYYVRFSAMGEDDYALGLNFEGTYEECLNKFNEWKELYNSIPELVDKNWFFEHGFTTD